MRPQPAPLRSPLAHAQFGGQIRRREGEKVFVLHLLGTIFRSRETEAASGRHRMAPDGFRADG